MRETIQYYSICLPLISVILSEVKRNRRISCIPEQIRSTSFAGVHYAQDDRGDKNVKLYIIANIIMDIVEFRDFCLSLPLAEECMPFDEDTLVMKIGGKMFTYASISQFSRFSVKCDPDQVLELTERHKEIGPPVHMSNRHWISVRTDGGLTDEFLRERLRESYRLVIASMTRKQRAELEVLINEARK